MLCLITATSSYHGRLAKMGCTTGLEHHCDGLKRNEEIEIWYVEEGINEPGRRAKIG